MTKFPIFTPPHTRKFQEGGEADNWWSTIEGLPIKVQSKTNMTLSNKVHNGKVKSKDKFQSLGLSTKENNDSAFTYLDNDNEAFIYKKNDGTFGYNFN